MHRKHRRLTFSLAWFLALALGSSSSPAGDPPKPEPANPDPASSVEFDGHRYLLVDEVEELTWDVGRERCEAWGGHLATIASKKEADFIAELCAGRYMYLGASDAATEGEWVWVDGTPWRYTHWMDGQPNDYSGSENYLATYDDGEWVDVDFDGSGFWMPTGFICEWDEPGRTD